MLAKKVPSQAFTYTVEYISAEDAAYLVAIGHKLGGASDGPRGAIQRLANALRASGVTGNAISFTDPDGVLLARSVYVNKA